MGHEDNHRVTHSDEAPIYTRPHQRQKWGEAQILPHSNFGDTFFDLFYVAGAYNLGSLIRAEPTSRGVLYFAACFFPLQIIWLTKMYFTSRVVIHDDVYHRMYEFGALVILGTAVLHIRPVSILSDPKNNIDMFALALTFAISGFVGWGRAIELYFKGVGQPAVKNAARRDIIWSIPTVILYIAAAFVAGFEYFGNHSSSYSTSGYATTDSAGYEDDHVNSTASNQGSRRILAAAAESQTSYPYEDNYENNTPIYLLLGGSLGYIFSLALMVFVLPGGGKHRAISIPMNIRWAIHRWGEFTMLMLGESILSLLIVDVTESSGYYKTFFCGIVSITLLEYLHFRSQPHVADDHALRRSKEAAIKFTMLMQIYSAALVVLGTAYKMLLYEYVYAAKEESSGSYRKLWSNPLARLLAGSDEPMFATAERQQRVSHFFCISMALVWLCSDLMIINHRGLKDNLGYCRLSHTGFLKFVALTLAFLRLGLIIFMATLSQWVTDPSVLAFVGLVGIISQVLLRVVGTSYFGPEYDGHDKDEASTENIWPNVTRPQVENQEAAED